MMGWMRHAVKRIEFAKRSLISNIECQIIATMYQAIEYGLSFRCVAHLYGWNNTQHHTRRHDDLGLAYE